MAGWQGALRPWQRFLCCNARPKYDLHLCLLEESVDVGRGAKCKACLICGKLGLKRGTRLLDIGCGWGSFMSYAAEHYGVTCLGITTSKKQANLARRRYPDPALEFRLQIYRDTTGQFDRIVSISMFEHVGR
jgi:cyclopropane-fatty-acyl-phospholipid synthase